MAIPISTVLANRSILRRVPEGQPAPPPHLLNAAIIELICSWTASGYSAFFVNFQEIERATSQDVLEAIKRSSLKWPMVVLAWSPKTGLLQYFPQAGRMVYQLPEGTL